VNVRAESECIDDDADDVIDGDWSDDWDDNSSIITASLYDSHRDVDDGTIVEAVGVSDGNK
jgi:hypothetical protein